MRGFRLQQANHIAHKHFKKVLQTDPLLHKHMKEENFEKYIGRLRKTRKRCSCWMCCNQRKQEGRTFQELRQLDIKK
jgi:hypothetical protein